MAKAPDYEERSKLVADACEEFERAAKEAARQKILEDLTGSVQTIKDLRNYSDANISLKACKEHLTLAGLYTQKVEHSGKIEGIQVYLPEVKSA